MLEQAAAAGDVPGAIAMGTPRATPAPDVAQQENLALTMESGRLDLNQ